jgi:bilirubin oxidase
MHGFPFYIIDRYGAPVGPEESGRKDMVMVSPNETLRIITWFSDFGDTEMPYMFHCHILTHEDEGMMGQFIVLPEPTSNLSSKTSVVTAMPNPFTDFIQIRDFDDNENLRIVNSLGIEMPVELSASGMINTSDWPVGIYVCRSAGKQTKLLKL